MTSPVMTAVSPADETITLKWSGEWPGVEIRLTSSHTR
jgi:hypothetical protein